MRFYRKLEANFPRGLQKLLIRCKARRWVESLVWNSDTVGWKQDGPDNSHP
jgi:hypothetical protein